MAARERSLAIAVLLIAVTAACFWHVGQNGFITLDDRTYIEDNAAVRSGLTWDGIVQAFTTVPLSYWQPVAFLSHMADVQFFGVNPGAHHLMSLAWHCANTVLLFFALLRLTGAVYRSAIVAAIFALHPMHVEAVAWAAARKELLSAFFFLAALWAYASKRFLLTFTAFALGLMAKPSIIGFPLVLLLLDYWPLHKTRWKAAAIEKIPFLLLAGISVLITLGTIDYSGRLAGDTHYVANDTPAAIRALNLMGQYLPKFFWPDRLNTSYIAEHLTPLWISCLTVIVISAAVIRFRRPAPYVFVGWFWFVVMVAPSTGLIMANRFSYLPFIGLSIAVVWGIGDLTARRLLFQRIAFSGAAVVLIVYGVLTFRQVAFWRDSYTLYEEAIANDPENYVARQWLGDTLGLQGRYREAIAQYEEALREHEYYFLAEVNCARLYLQISDEPAAIRHYTAAIRLRPGMADPYKELGDVFLTQGNLADALMNYKKAQELQYADAKRLRELITSVESALQR